MPPRGRRSLPSRGSMDCSAPFGGAPARTRRCPRRRRRSEPLLQGAAAFNATTSRDVKPLLSHLADVGQTPQALFITCADSRIVPADLVNADPGDIFVLRNIGNIVPTWTGVPGSDDSVGSAIEFAVDVLKVHSIIVCGHSECGAMKALLGGHEALGGSLGRWLAHGTSALTRHAEAPVAAAARPPRRTTRWRAPTSWSRSSGCRRIRPCSERWRRASCGCTAGSST